MTTRPGTPLRGSRPEGGIDLAIGIGLLVVAGCSILFDGAFALASWCCGEGLRWAPLWQVPFDVAKALVHLGSVRAISPATSRRSASRWVVVIASAIVSVVTGAVAIFGARVFRPKRAIRGSVGGSRTADSGL